MYGAIDMLLSLFPIYLFSQVYIHLAFNRLTKGGSDLVWYSIDRDIFKTESIFCRKDKSIQLDLGSVYLDLYSLLIPDIK